jgi:2-phosphosulfolactate phosphatase
MDIKLYLTPDPSGEINLKGKTAVVIDVLRCTTSVCAALMAGARGVIPVTGPGEAGEMWARIGSDMGVLAGEQNGIRIENFQLGNSPAEFTPESVGGKFVVMTTTNGTTAFVRAHKADLVLSCGLVNVSRVAGRVAGENRNMVIVCAGQDGQFSIEDTICGGRLIDLLISEHQREVTLNDAASLAVLLYHNSRSAMKKVVAEGEHGRYLTSIGFAHDLEIASRVDSMPVLPVMRDGRLILDGD